MANPDVIHVEEGNVVIENQRVNFTIPKYGAVIVTVSQDSTVGVGANYNVDKQDYHLYTNYPNPFNPRTVISYRLAFNSKVTLKVYNLLGEEVTTLVNDEKSAGEYRVVFDASHLSSGVYFYTLNAISTENGTNFLQTKKFTLLK
jgi:glutathionyl-hydroquinone reductase